MNSIINKIPKIAISVAGCFSVPRLVSVVVFATMIPAPTWGEATFPDSAIYERNRPKPITIACFSELGMALCSWRRSGLTDTAVWSRGYKDSKAS